MFYLQVPNRWREGEIEGLDRGEEIQQFVCKYSPIAEFRWKVEQCQNLTVKGLGRRMGEEGRQRLFPGGDALKQRFSGSKLSGLF